MKTTSYASILLGSLVVACGGQEPAPLAPSTPAASAASSAPVATTPAAPQTAAATPPPPPGPSPEQKKTVDAFVGDWTYEATITVPKGKPTKTPIGMACKAIAAGKGVNCMASEVFPGLGPFEAQFLIGLDPLDKTLHFMAITSDDELHDHRCKWKDDKNVACEPLKGGYAGQAVTEDLSFSFEGAPSFRSVSTMKDGSKIIFEAMNGKKGALPPKKDVGKAKTPSPSAEQKKTAEAFAGTWEVEGSLTGPDGKAAKFPIKINSSKYAFGKGASATMTATSPMGPIEGSFLVGFDPFDKTVHFIAIMNQDEFHDHRCKWADDKHITCEPLNAGLGGAPAIEELAFTFESANAMSWKSVTTMKDGAKFVFEGSGKR